MCKKSLICKLFTSLILVFFLGIGFLGYLDAAVDVGSTGGDGMEEGGNQEETERNQEEADGRKKSKKTRSCRFNQKLDDDLDEDALLYMMDMNRGGGRRNRMFEIDPVNDLIRRINNAWLPPGEPLSKEFMGKALLAAGVGGGLKAFGTTIDEESRTLFGNMFYSIKGVFGKIRSFLFHGGARSVTSHDINRWYQSIENMLKGLGDILQTSQRNLRTDRDLDLSVFQNSGDEQPGEKQEQETKNIVPVDENWQENSKIYLGRILQIIREIEARKQYYKQTDEIVVSLNALSMALVGDVKIIDKDGSDELIWGGIYSRIAAANSLNDLATDETTTAFKLFHGHIKGLLEELLAWVSEKDEMSGSKKLGNSSRLSRSSRSSLGSDW